MSSSHHISFIAGGVRVFFPHEPYDTQREYVESVIKAISQRHHALLESPTGTGKTLSLLCSSLAWLQSQGGAAKTIIYYTSRTHMQLAQAAKEMKRTAYARNPAVVIGSRAQMCLNDEVKQQSGDHLINRACRNAIAKNACSYHLNYEKKLEVMDMNSVKDIEDLCQFGRTHQCCPYYASKKIAETKASVVFMPYNYLLDTSLRKSVQLKLENSVIIFDEAHNIEGVLKDSVSGLFTQSCLKTIQDSCLKLPAKIHEALNKEKHGFSRYGYDPKDKGIVDEFAKQKGSKADKEPRVNPIEELAEKLTNDKLQQVNRCAEILKSETTNMLKIDTTNAVDKIYHLMKAANVVFSTSSTIITTLDSMASFWSIAGVMNPALVAKYVSAITNLCQVISLLYPDNCPSQDRQSNHEKRVSEFYTTHLKGIYDASVVLRKGDLKDWQLDLWCLHPAIGLKRVIDSNCIRGPRSLIVTSGTLAPMRVIGEELECEFKTIKEFKHIIGDNQLKIMVVGKSLDDYSLESHFEATKKDDYFKALGNTLTSLFQVLPYGTLVFFQSYSLLNRAVKFWKDKSTIYRNMTSASSIFVESQQQGSFLGDVASFKRKIETQGSRAVFFGVCRGKLSEGVNLEGNHCRTVILTGLPFPSMMDPKVVATRAFHARKGDSNGNLWYSQQMTRAMNQTIGRVIRSRSDFGMLLLCDPRFSGYKYSLSEWTRKYFPPNPTPIVDVELTIKAFFHEHGITITQTASQDAGAFEIDLSKRLSLAMFARNSPFSEASSKSSQSSQISNRSREMLPPSPARMSARDRQASMLAGYTVDKETYMRVKSSRVIEIEIDEEEQEQATCSKRLRTTADIFESVCTQSQQQQPLESQRSQSNSSQRPTTSVTNGVLPRQDCETQQQQVNGSIRPQNRSQQELVAESEVYFRKAPKSLNIWAKKKPQRDRVNSKQSTDATSSQTNSDSHNYSCVEKYLRAPKTSYECTICRHGFTNGWRTNCSCARVLCQRLLCLNALKNRECGRCHKVLRKKDFKELCFMSAELKKERQKNVTRSQRQTPNFIMLSHVLLSVETTLLLSVQALYIVHCPFNKVEESFNTQAVHDIINIFPDNLPYYDLGNNSSQALTTDTNQLEVAIRSQLPWDHIQFPGVVPRTFVGAFIVGLPLKLAKYFMTRGYLLSEQNDNADTESEPDLTSQFVLQIGSRFALSSFVVLSLSAITRAIHRRYGLLYRICFLLATVSQFHYMFYAGRFLPNTFATILANLVFASWINRQYSKSVVYIALCVVIFRFDTAIFFGWLLFDAVFIKKCLPVGRLLKVGIPSGLMAILITFTVDSVFWARPVWPEFEGLYFNLWLNKSYEWGTQPYFWYIYSCLPRMLMSSAPLLLLADHKITRDYLIPTLAFIFTYSILPHKEMRFILFITPFLNICAASGLMNVYFYLNKLFLYLYYKVSKNQVSENSRSSKQNRQSKNDTRRNDADQQKSYIAASLFILILFGMFTANIFSCFILSRISSHNYPGGHAGISLGMTKELLDKAQKSIGGGTGIRDPRSDVAVYVNNLAAQTGMSRFVQVNGVYYAKTPELDMNTFKKSYNLIYLIYEPKEITNFLKNNCPIEQNQKLFDYKADKWKTSDSEIKCIPPNQERMFCSIIDTMNSFQSVNFGGLIRRLRTINSVELAINSLDDAGFIKTRVALHVIRCATRSKFNPFS